MAGSAVLLHIARNGALIALPQANTNGTAYDPATDRLAILYDTAPGTVRWFGRAGKDLSATDQVLTLPSNFADHVCFDPVTGELLVTWGDNGGGGAIGSYDTRSYGGWALVGVDTLTGADAIEASSRLPTTIESSTTAPRTQDRRLPTACCAIRPNGSASQRQGVRQVGRDA